MKEPERLLLKPMEAAVALGIGRQKIYELIATNKIPTIQLGRSTMIPLEELRAWIRRETKGQLSI